MQDLLVENNVISTAPESKRISWKVPAGISVAVLVILGIVQVVISNQVSSPTPQVSQQSASPTASPTATPTPTASALPSATPSPSATAKAPSGPVILTLIATRGNSFIDIIVDGKRIVKGSIFQGETKRYVGEKAISVYLSNPGGLDVTLNGKLLTDLGGENEEVRRTFR